MFFLLCWFFMHFLNHRYMCSLQTTPPTLPKWTPFITAKFVNWEKHPKLFLIGSNPGTVAWRRRQWRHGRTFMKWLQERQYMHLGINIHQKHAHVFIAVAFRQRKKGLLNWNSKLPFMHSFFLIKKKSNWNNLFTQQPSDNSPTPPPISPTHLPPSLQSPFASGIL